MCIHMCTYIYIYVHIHTSVLVYVGICVWIYIFPRTSQTPCNCRSSHQCCMTCFAQTHSTSCQLCSNWPSNRVFPSRVPPALMNHAKLFKGWSPQMPLGSWYRTGTKISARPFWSGGNANAKLDWIIQLVPHKFVRRNRSSRIKFSKQNSKYLYWMICKVFFWNRFTGKWT